MSIEPPPLPPDLLPDLAPLAERSDLPPKGHWVFILLFCLSLAFLVPTIQGPSIRNCFFDSGKNKATPGESFELIVQAKMIIALNEIQNSSQASLKAEIGALKSPFSKVSPVNSLQAMVKDKASPNALLRALALAGYLGWKDQANQIAKRLKDAEETGGMNPDQRRLSETLCRFYGEEARAPLSEDEAHLVHERFGWFARVVECDQWLLTDPPKGREAKAALRVECRRALIVCAAAFMIGLCLCLVGVVLLMVFLILSYAGRTRWGELRARVMQSLANGAGGFQPWQAFEAFTLYLTVFAAAMIAVNAMSLPKSGMIRLAAQLWTLAAAAVLLWPLARGARFLEARRWVGLVRGRGAGVEALAGAAGYAGIFPLMVGAAIATALWASRLGISAAEGAHPLAPLVAESPAWGLRIYVLFLAVIVAPVMEEIMFRGLFYGWLRSVMRAPAAVIVCGLLFASLHPQGILGVPTLFVLGAGFSILREWRGSLIAPILAHALVNGGTMAILMLL